MAAPAYQSSQTTGWTTATSIAITKPTSLAVGDLMIARHTVETASYGSWGFTDLGNNTDGVSQYGTRLGFKIADSSDVAASSFTFSTNGSKIQFGSITRITGADTGVASVKFGGAATTDTANPSLAAGVTPTDHGDSVLLLVFWSESTTSAGIGTYAIATSNPSWTEAYDVSNGSLSPFSGASLAYATRSQLTATGNISANGGNATTDWTGQILAIAVPLTIIATDTVTLTEVWKENIKIVQQETAILTEAATATPTNPITNTTKSSSTWINTTKS